VTVGGDGSPKVVHVSVSWVADLSAGNLDGTSSRASAGAFRCRPGGGTLRNLAQPGPVTLVFPPPEPGAYSMLIDGTGRVVDDTDPRGDMSGTAGTPDTVEVSFRGGVLHRPATTVSGDPTSC